MSVDLDSPEQVARELRARGLPVHRAEDVIGTDQRLRDLSRWARLGGWDPKTHHAPRPRHINLGHLREVLADTTQLRSGS